MFFYQRNLVKVLAVSLLVVCTFISCSAVFSPASQKESVSINLVIPAFIASSAPANKEALSQSQGRFVSPDTRSILVSITGENMTEKTQLFSIPGGSTKETLVINEVPAGLKRTITVTLKDSSGTILASGSSLIDIVDETSNSASITPIPVNAIPITSGSPSSPVTSAWAGKTLVFSVTLTSGNYVVNNYISGTNQSSLAIYNADGSSVSSVVAGTTPGTWNFISTIPGLCFIAVTLPVQYSGGATVQVTTVTGNPTYTVTYDGNTNTSGTVPSDANQYQTGATVTALLQGSLVKTGATFAGWNTMPNGTGTAYAANTTFAIAAANITLYAQWTTNPTYTVTYNGNGNSSGTVPSDANQYQTGATVTVLAQGSLVKTGATFTGWDTLANGTGTAYAANTTFAIAATNITLYAQWTTNPTYTVTYNGNGNSSGTIPSDANQYQTGATVTALPQGSLVKTGATFAGWNTLANGTGTAYAANTTFVMTAANVSLYAQWTTNPTYTVTYNGNGNTSGTVPSDANQYQTGATVTVLAQGSLVKTGATFAGWNTLANGTGSVYPPGTPFVIAAANITLYAQWTTNPTYTVTYNGNTNTSGTVPSDANQYQTGATVTVLAQGSLVKTGATFAGWNTMPNGTGTAYAANTTFAMTAANVSLYAQWLTTGDLNVSVSFANLLDPLFSISGNLAIANSGTLTLSSAAGFDSYQWLLNGTPLSGQTTNQCSLVCSTGTYPELFIPGNNTLTLVVGTLGDYYSAQFKFTITQ